MLVLVLWGAWLAMLLYLYVQHRMAVVHPQFLPLIVLLAVQTLAAIGLLLGGVWRLVRGPERAQALAWGMLGTFPLWLVSAYASYTSRVSAIATSASGGTDSMRLVSWRALVWRTWKHDSATRTGSRAGTRSCGPIVAGTASRM